MRHIYKRSKAQILREIISDPERKSLTVMLREFFYLWVVHREIPVHYFSRYLFKQGTHNIRDYVPNRLSGRIVPNFNDPRLKQTLDNKLYFNLFFRQFDIPTPEIVAFNHRELMAYDGQAVCINTIEKFREILIELFNKHQACDSLFIKSIYSSSSGRNIHLIPRGFIDGNNKMLNEIYRSVRSSEFVFQPRIKQHPELNRINPASLNTIRIDTFFDKTGTVEIISAFLKMSTNNLPVDNNTSGGCGVGIDLGHGILRNKGYSKIRVSGISILTEHPVSGVKFEGFKIPMFHEVKELVLKSAQLVPGLRLIGWDVGVTEDGPIIIEGNSDYGVNSNDLMYGGYLTNDTFRKVLREMRKNSDN